MTDWYKSQCGIDTVPEAFAVGISSKYVYQHKNIERKSNTDQDGKVTEYWEYDERKLTYEEYYRLQTEKNTADIDYIMAMTDIE
jgi:hypothetical protein